MAAITLENLSKHFGAFAALKELNLEVRDRDSWRCLARQAAARPRR